MILSTHARQILHQRITNALLQVPAGFEPSVPDWFSRANPQVAVDAPIACYVPICRTHYYHNSALQHILRGQAVSKPLSGRFAAAHYGPTATGGPRVANPGNLQHQHKHHPTHAEQEQRRPGATDDQDAAR